ncbi:MAG: penicillin-binding protein activator [Gammaproteobacteria bacterium]|nr:penicillin-binding protein activator [Gammaproteobacteria bacterium]MCB1903566.1 penicillin-binding protein activator [Gammaproteobacteria bacterium]
MQPKKWNTLRCLLLLVLLAGCVPSPQLRPDLQQATRDPLVEQAEGYASSGDYVAAAELFEQIAAEKPFAENQRLLLRAAENRFLAADPNSAAALLERINTAELPILDFQRRLLTAEMAIARNRPDEALTLLSAAPPEAVSIDLRRRYTKDRSEAFRLSGNPMESGRELESLDQLLDDQTDKLENQLDIIRTYGALSDMVIQQSPPPTDTQRGWLAMVRILKEFASDEALIRLKFREWRKTHPAHPALPELLDGYFLQLQSQFLKPRNIAVLLPESGPYARVASLLRDGLLAAYFAAESTARPRLYFYDNSNPEATWPLYQEAVESGADMVIGPLDKESVAQLNRAMELQVPVLALNQIASESLPSPDLYQFGLLPEDEAIQVADRAWTDGYTVAVSLTPAGDWGDRIAAAFRARWEELGGVLAEQQSYDDEAHDFSKPIQALLNIDESYQRHKSLQQLLGRSLEFQPRRRRDAGFLFLAAKSQKARQIRPQLQFHHAADLPIYTTSHAYSGVLSPDEDQDLNGIKFPVTPWLLVAADESDQLSLEHLRQLFPSTPPSYLPLLAMGIDSLHLIPHLARLQSSPREILEGKTGNIFMDRAHHLRRQMLWAEMVRGVPQVTGFSPRLDSGIGAFPEVPPQAPDALPEPLERIPAPAGNNTVRKSET